MLIVVIAAFLGGILGGVFATQLLDDDASAQDRGAPLNADTVDNYSANQIVRATAASAVDVVVPANGSPVKAAGAQMKTPKNGWVMASVSGVAEYSDYWRLRYLIVDSATCPATPPAEPDYQIDVQSGETPFAVQRAFDMPRGTHDFSVCVWKTDGAAPAQSLATVDLILTHVPFDFDGGKP
jgi:hypothetical protein